MGGVHNGLIGRAKYEANENRGFCRKWPIGRSRGFFRGFRVKKVISYLLVTLLQFES